jgi:hypothetical protein
MAIRGNRSLAGLELSGYARQVFIERLLYGTGKTHGENKTALWKWYSALVSELPQRFVGKEETYNNDILPLLNDALEIQENIHELYRSSFEDLGTCSDEEKAFEWQMNLAFLKLDTITAKSKLIDGEKGPVADMDVIG